MSARVLLLEDDRDLALITEAALSEEGFAVTIASTVDDALERSRADRFDIAVVDLHLREESGWRFVREVRAASGYRMSIVIHSVHTGEPSTFERAEDWAVDAVVPKRGDPDDLVRRLREILGRIAASG